MTLAWIIVSIGLMFAYGVLFLRPKYRLLSAAIISAAIFFLYLALAGLGSEAVNRLSVIMLGITALGAVALGICHVVFERGQAGRLTGTRRAPGADKPARELFP